VKVGIIVHIVSGALWDVEMFLLGDLLEIGDSARCESEYFSLIVHNDILTVSYSRYVCLILTSSHG